MKILVLNCPNCKKMLSNIWITNIDHHPITDYEKRELTFKCFCGHSITIPTCPYDLKGVCIYPTGCIMSIFAENFCGAHSYCTNQKYKEVSIEDRKLYVKKLISCFEQEEVEINV